jgi:hypothetical protein
LDVRPGPRVAMLCRGARAGSLVDCGAGRRHDPESWPGNAKAPAPVLLGQAAVKGGSVGATLLGVLVAVMLPVLPVASAYKQSSR